MLFRMGMKFILSFFVVLVSSRAFADSIAKFQADKITIEFNANLASRVVEANADFSEAERVFLANEKHSELFAFVGQENLKNKLIIKGKSSQLEKTITLETSADFPGAILIQVEYKNMSPQSVHISSWEGNRYQMKATGNEIWSYLPASYEKRPDWLKKLKPGVKEKNFLGMNSTDYGGGTPVLGVWHREGGLAIGSVELEPKLISLPVEYKKKGLIELAMQSDVNIDLKPKESFKTFKSFVTTFKGDIFNPLRAYANYMESLGIKRATSPKDIGPIWCAWGYGRDFTVDQVIKTLPEAKRLGFEWVGLDDGWQTAIGDWTVNTKKFPRGEEDLKKLVDEIHKMGMKAQLWWAPLAAHQKSKYVSDFKDRLLLNENNTPREITWWDSSYLCPAEENVQKDMAALAKKFIKEWGFDGLKIDGQHLNASPQCYNKTHKHSSPEVSFSEHAMIFKQIYKAAKSANSDVLVETCPCGTSYSIYNLPYQNMTVASDPESSLQVRQKGKVLKALTGDKVVFFGDHVELSEKSMDFASTMAVGGLVGSNFTLPSLNKNPPIEGEPNTKLDPKREKHWEKWIAIAKQKRLWEGEYLGDVYDIGFDKPESHLVKKGDNYYYAFFAENFKGTIALKGLPSGGKFTITDYIENKTLGNLVVVSDQPNSQIEIKTSFKKFLLLELSPVAKIAKGY